MNFVMMTPMVSFIRLMRLGIILICACHGHLYQQNIYRTYTWIHACTFDIDYLSLVHDQVGATEATADGCTDMWQTLQAALNEDRCENCHAT